VATILIFLCFYLFQTFGMIETGFLKRLVNGLRYFDPLLPVLAFAMAESVPRLLGARLTPRPEREPLRRLATAAAGLWLVGVLAVSFLVHPVFDRWTASQMRIRDALLETVPVDAVLVANHGLGKFVDDLGRPYTTLYRSHLSPEELDQLRDRFGGYFVALLDRSDSAYWREDAAANAGFVAQLGEPAPLVDLRVTGTDRLRIWRIDAERR
jgi:hypothetical protein